MDKIPSTSLLFEFDGLIGNLYFFPYIYLATLLTSEALGNFGVLNTGIDNQIIISRIVVERTKSCKKKTTWELQTLGLEYCLNIV